MRLNEIEDINQNIEKLFKKYFQFASSTGSYLIKNDKINIIGSSCNVKKQAQLTKLPIIFNRVKFSLNINNIGLETLEGSPRYVGVDFRCQNNNLKSLIGAPKSVTNFYCYDNPLESLEGIPDEIKNLIALPYNENLPLLRLLFVKNLTYINFVNTSTDLDKTHLQSILSKYKGKGKGAALQCAIELIKSGYRGNARL